MPKIKSLCLKLSTVEKTAKEFKGLLEEQVEYERIAHPMDSVLAPGVADAMEECLETLKELLDAMDFDPTPQDSSGEPPLSANEIATISWRQHTDLHR